MEQDDFFQHIKATNAKLKKRFMKKPNVAEACNDFANLSRQLRQKGCPQYAGYCCIAKAKCEETLLYHNQAAESLLEAARYFKEANTALEDSSCPNFREHLTNAEDLYSQAIKKFSINKKNPRAASVCFEFAEYLFNLRRYAESLQYYKECVYLITEVPMLEIKTRNMIVQCEILIKDYSCALKSSFDLKEYISSQMCYHSDKKTPIGVYHQLYQECMVMCLFLLLKVNQHPEYMNEKHKKFICQFKIDFDSAETGEIKFDKQCITSKTLFINLAAFVDAFYDGHQDDLDLLQQNIRPYLTTTQNYLMEMIKC